ncbi:mitogen-activated protein kinase kinase kinase 20 [Actinidia eriantha]|uniref:mitogen-activated protein kinase kinase kinase 20 n=1 Tax=Actinidia eriantha TaxID=165200 RepID=UPI002584C6BE|nr:mitogen-activated protein kinase kinase kinase 20 [Actinidia eriantha]
MEWVRGETIGRGSFGTVSLAIPRSQNLRIPQLMAVKSCGSSHFALLMSEKSILEELQDCPQIIRCFGGNFGFEGGEKLYNLFLEYASGGDLARKLKNSRDRRLPESEVRRYTNSILKGLRHIHNNGFVHCDMKLQNILLCCSEDGRSDVAKIGDFGLAKRAGARREKTGVELRGTPLYMPPETVAAGDQEAAADVWALGCLVAEMATGAPAWRCTADDDVWRLLMRIGVGEEIPEIPGNLSPAGKDFLGKCFVRDPKNRWTAEMLLNHPFVADQTEDNHSTVRSEHTCEASDWTSPRGPFDFPDWDIVESPSSTTPLPFPKYSSESTSDSSAADRLRPLVTGERSDWSVSDSWVTVR